MRACHNARVSSSPLIVDDSVPLDASRASQRRLRYKTNGKMYYFADAAGNIDARVLGTP